ncbi:MAG: 16S rRNA (cytidine(1402)-2'-O)-methyltransferase [Betaproteobacteria bacterium]|nr:16S rRNA (cytidine(1402)-2'-O)-methyltransferase [Betaproteobacteria bacterium]
MPNDLPPATGTLYIVATPIGNLSDLSARGRDVLTTVDLIACEDTRTTRPLLAAHGIAAKTLALHEHNERSARATLLDLLAGGKNVALVSDAGTPAISDPGALVVEAAHHAGIRVVPVPGPNAAVAAYCASGFLASRFLFAGFLPASAGARRKTLASLDVACPVILYEAPHRILATLEDLCSTYGAEHEIVIARELTKKFEEIARMPLGGASAWIASNPHRQRGEFVLVLGPKPRLEQADDGEADRVLRVLLADLSVSQAAHIAARLTGGSKNDLYRRALALAGADAAGTSAEPL